MTRIACGSGGWSKPKEENSKSAIPAQLYDMEANPSETVNLYEEKPEVVSSLLANLEKEVFSGRSTLGESYENDLKKIVF